MGQGNCDPPSAYPAYTALQQLLEYGFLSFSLLGDGMALGLPAQVTYDASASPTARSLSRVDLRSGSLGLFRESVLQGIVDQTPSILPIRDFFPAASAVFSLGCEIPVNLGERKGYIDNVLVTDDGHLVLVETKLWRNPESIREVIAQVFEYSMAVGGLTLRDLECVLRRGDPTSARLGPDETIALRVQKGTEGAETDSVGDDFEDSFARFRQSGEILVLIVTDGVQTSVERLTRWFEEKLGPGSPLRLGVVELRFFEDGGKHVVVPVTLLRTRELGRHTVVVEVKGGAAADINVSVTEGEAGVIPTTRTVSKQEPPLTKDAFLVRARTALPAEKFGTVQTIVAGLDQLGLATKGTPTTWQYGVPGSASFLGLAMLGDSYLWCQIPARLRALLGGERFVECKRILNGVAPFYRPEDVEDPAKVNALTPHYDAIVGKEQEFIQAISAVAGIAGRAIREVA